MAQVFDKGAVLALKLGLIVVFVVFIAAMFAWRWAIDYPNAKNSPVNQPVPFSHKHHVGDDGIDCRYCHFAVESSASAGMPSSEVCMTCHSQLFKDAPLLAPVRRSVASNRPLKWTRVHDLPGFVYFNHAAHVTHGVPCQACHGRVDEMPLTSKVQSLEMQWCLECHRNPAQALVARDAVFAMQPRSPGTEEQQNQWLAVYHIPSIARLTDCSSCHR